jgi:hypothetical protein
MPPSKKRTKRDVQEMKESRTEGKPPVLLAMGLAPWAECSSLEEVEVAMRGVYAEQVLIPGTRLATPEEKEEFIRSKRQELIAHIPARLEHLRQMEEVAARDEARPRPAPVLPRDQKIGVEHGATWYDAEERRREQSLRDAAARPAELYDPNGL